MTKTDGKDAVPIYKSSNSFYASVSFWSAIGVVWWGKLTPRQLGLVKEYIASAHQLGLKVRFWDTPAWPITVRNHVWKILVREGADYLNVDDLRGATRLDWQ